MKVLLIHQYFLEDDDPGGSRWNEMSKMWSTSGHEVTVIAGMMHAHGSKKKQDYRGKFFVKRQQKGVTVWRCHVSESYNKSFAGRLWGYFSFMFSGLWCGMFLVKGKFDAVIVTSPPLFVGFSGYVIAKLKRSSFIFEIRDLWPESAVDIGVLKNKFLIKLSYWFENFIYKKADLITVLTPAFYEILKEKKKVSVEKLCIIPNASDFSLSERLMNTFDRSGFRQFHDLEEHFVITYVGAHGVANHLEQVIYAAESLADTNVLFLFIGQGMEKEKLIKLAKIRNIKNVRFLDPVAKKDVFKYILASEMCLSVLKKVETFKTVYSNKTFDYMSCKRPILMAIDGVSRNLVQDAKAGSYIEPENTVAYNTIIRSYLNQPERLAIEGENGYSFARKNFDREILSKKYLTRLKQVLK